MRSSIARTGICILALSAALGGCATTGGEAGAISGAVIDGVAGHALTGSTAGTVVGAGAGALIGNRIGRDYDRGYYTY
jgi:uncharacterized protein YcfJ